MKLTTHHSSTIEYVLTDDENRRQITYIVPYTAYPRVPATYEEPEEGGIEMADGAVVAIEFLDAEGGQLGGYSLAACTLPEWMVAVIEDRYLVKFCLASSEIMREIEEYEHDRDEDMRTAEPEGI